MTQMTENANEMNADMSYEEMDKLCDNIQSCCRKIDNVDLNLGDFVIINDIPSIITKKTNKTISYRKLSGKCVSNL